MGWSGAAATVAGGGARERGDARLHGKSLCHGICRDSCVAGKPFFLAATMNQQTLFAISEYGKRFSHPLLVPSTAL